MKEDSYAVTAIVSILGIALIVLIAKAWGDKIEDMNDNHHDYKGDDFLD